MASRHKTPPLARSDILLYKLLFMKRATLLLLLFWTPFLQAQTSERPQPDPRFLNAVQQFYETGYQRTLIDIFLEDVLASTSVDELNAHLEKFKPYAQGEQFPLFLLDVVSRYSAPDVMPSRDQRVMTLWILSQVFSWRSPDQITPDMVKAYTQFSAQIIEDEERDLVEREAAGRLFINLCVLAPTHIAPELFDNILTDDFRRNINHHFLVELLDMARFLILTPTNDHLGFLCSKYEAAPECGKSIWGRINLQMLEELYRVVSSTGIPVTRIEQTMAGGLLNYGGGREQQDPYILGLRTAWKRLIDINAPLHWDLGVFLIGGEAEPRDVQEEDDENTTRLRRSLAKVCDPVIRGINKLVVDTYGRKLPDPSPWAPRRGAAPHLIPQAAAARRIAPPLPPTRSTGRLASPPPPVLRSPPPSPPQNFDDLVDFVDEGEGVLESTTLSAPPQRRSSTTKSLRRLLPLQPLGDPISDDITRRTDRSGGDVPPRPKIENSTPRHHSPDLPRR